MHYNYYKLSIVFFNNAAVCITKKGNNIILFLAKILNTYYIAVVRQYYKEKQRTNYKIIIYLIKYIKNTVYIYI